MHSNLTAADVAKYVDDRQTRLSDRPAKRIISTNNLKYRPMQLTKEEATSFFSIFYGGEHHFPSSIKERGPGWRIIHNRDLSTFDFYALTKLVLMAHKYCIRVSVATYGVNRMKITIWKRQREGSLSMRHPTIEQAIKNIVLPENLLTNDTQ